MLSVPSQQFFGKLFDGKLAGEPKKNLLKQHGCLKTNRVKIWGGPGAQKLKQMKRAKKADFSVLQRGDDDDDGEEWEASFVSPSQGNAVNKKPGQKM